MQVEKKVVLEMYTILNKLVYRQDFKKSQLDNIKIDVNRFTPGTYFMRITTDEMPHTFLVVVE